MKRQLALRQRVRKGLITTAFLFFPLTLYYFSPVLIIEGAVEGIVTGSAITFALLFVSSLFVGRLWCGWACPGAGLQEALFSVNNKPVHSRWAGRVKWSIWIPWIPGIGAAFVRFGWPSLHLVAAAEQCVNWSIVSDVLPTAR
jgi:polyferredoxin